MFFRKPDFSYKPSTITNEPNIEQPKKTFFTNIKYGEYVHLYKHTQYGEITGIGDGYIYTSFDDDIIIGSTHAITKDEYIDFSSLKVGQKIMATCYMYSFGSGLGYGRSAVLGIWDKNEYENPIRDSQMLPKGWKHEPYYTVSIRRGTLKYDFGWYMEPDDALNTQYILKDSIDSYACAATSNSRIVELTFTITLPDDKIEVKKVLCNEWDYDDCIAKNERNKVR